MAGPVVAADRLTKRFGALTALDRLDLVVQRGEVLGYLGPNGAGKTTTIRLLLDALRPTEGSVVVFGGAPRDPAIRARIGYLPAELRVDRRYSANDLLAFFGSLNGSRR